MTNERKAGGFWKGTAVGAICTIAIAVVTVVPFIGSTVKGMLRIAEAPARVDMIEDTLRKSSDRIASVERNQQRQAEDMATGFARIEQLVKNGRIGTPRQMENN